jgi:hypothetical protein
MNADGTGIRLLGEGTAPSWSPDGSSLAFVSDVSVWIMNSDGSGRRRLTDPLADTNRIDRNGLPLIPVGDLWPLWSPDGTRIALTRAFAGQEHLFFTVAPSGGPLHLIGGDTGLVISDWSPESLRLVGFSLGLGINNPGGAMWGSLADGRGLFFFVRQDRRYAPVWSPDGSWWGFGSSTNSAPTDIAIETFYVGALNLTNHPASDTDPDWQSLNPYPVGLVDPATGIWHLRSESAAVTSFYYGNPGDFPMMGDWDGDGIDTPGLFRRSDGFVYLRNSNTQGVADIRFFFGNPGDTPLAGDFDGDGLDTVSIYRPSEGRVYVINHLGSGDTGLGAADFSYFFGNPSDKPFVGDFNGDGIDTVGLHRESTGLMYFRNTHVQGPAEWSFTFGDPGDRVVAFDWNHDGSDSPAVFRPSNNKVYIRFNNTIGVADREYFFGQSNWLPVSGEFGLS